MQRTHRDRRDAPRVERARDRDRVGVQLDHGRELRPRVVERRDAIEEHARHALRRQRAGRELRLELDGRELDDLRVGELGFRPARAGARGERGQHRKPRRRVERPCSNEIRERSRGHRTARGPGEGKPRRRTLPSRHATTTTPRPPSPSRRAHARRVADRECRAARPQQRPDRETARNQPRRREVSRRERGREARPERPQGAQALARCADRQRPASNAKRRTDP